MNSSSATSSSTSTFVSFPLLNGAQRHTDQTAAAASSTHGTSSVNYQRISSGSQREAATRSPSLEERVSYLEGENRRMSRIIEMMNIMQTAIHDTTLQNRSLGNQISGLETQIRGLENQINDLRRSMGRLYRIMQKSIRPSSHHAQQPGNIDPSKGADEKTLIGSPLNDKKLVGNTNGENVHPNRKMAFVEPSTTTCPRSSRASRVLVTSTLRTNGVGATSGVSAAPLRV